eukprot:sb/3477478/
MMMMMKLNALTRRVHKNYKLLAVKGTQILTFSIGLAFAMCYNPLMRATPQLWPAVKPRLLEHPGGCGNFLWNFLSEDHHQNSEVRKMAAWALTVVIRHNCHCSTRNLA